MANNSLQDIPNLPAILPLDMAPLEVLLPLDMALLEVLLLEEVVLLPLLMDVCYKITSSSFSNLCFNPFFF